MKVKITDKKEGELAFEISETTPAIANAVRRTIIAKTNTLAFDTIDIHKNSSAIYNEILGHRIGMIPLAFKTPLKRKDECKCEGKGCTECTVKLVLKKRGPCTVYAKDFKSTDKDVKPTHPDIMIAQLQESQEIDLEGTAIMGKWSEHAKWQPSNQSYEYDEKDPTKITFRIKSVSGMSPEDIVSTAMTTLKSELEDIKKNIK